LLVENFDCSFDAGNQNCGGDDFFVGCYFGFAEDFANAIAFLVQVEGNGA